MNTYPYAEEPVIPHEVEKPGTPLILDPEYVDPYNPNPYQ